MGWEHSGTFSKVHEFVENSIFSPRSACLSISQWALHLLAIFSKVHEFVQNCVFSPRDQHVLSIARWTYIFLAIFSKLHKFVQNSVFKPRPARFSIFALGARILSDFQQSAQVCIKYKTAFSAQHHHVLSFSHWAYYVLAIFRKVHEFLQDSVFNPRSARFVVFALGTLLFSGFQQSIRDCTKQLLCYPSGMFMSSQTNLTGASYCCQR